MTMNVDFLVVGAGIVGLTTAHELKSRFPSARVVVLEKEAGVGRHASGRNSGVLHSGIYYAGDTLKAKVCAKGAALMRDFAAEQGIPCRTWGKVIVATREEDLPAVDRLLKNARDSRIRAERLDEAGIRKIEPHARSCGAGIYSPDTAVIDSRAVLDRLRDLLASKGVEVLFGEEAIDIDPAEKAVRTRNERYGFGFLFNCAGAYADVVARSFGLCRDYALIPFKGIYYKLDPARDWLVKSSIYPVPDLFLPFLGVHLTRLVDGRVYVGPTAIPAFGRENYGVLRGIRWGESARIGWEMAALYLRDRQNFRRLVHAEIRKYLKPFFLEAAQRLVPSLTAEDLLPCDKVGIRPQLVNVRTKKLEMDYILERTPHSLHVLNAISPAFTGSFAFARLIVDRYEEGS